MERQRDNRPPQVYSVYRAPAAMAVFVVSLVLWLASSEAESSLRSQLLLRIDEPTLRSFLTSHLFHVNGFHLSLNVVAILVVGGILETRWGTLRFVGFYLFCALGVSGISVLVGSLSGVGGVSCGASGVALGCLVTVGMLYPEHRLVRNLPPAKHLVWILIFAGGAGLAAMHLVDRSVAQEPGFVLLPQVSGVAFAMLFVCVDPWCLRIAEKWRERRERERVRKVREIRNRVDQLLEKISSHGSESLTRDEKAFLQRASKHYRSGRES